MGNSIVIPSLGNWYVEPLKKMKIRVLNIIESSTFFLALDCRDRDGTRLIVKAYEYDSKLSKIDTVTYSLDYFQRLNSLHEHHQAVVGYDPIQVIDRFAFLIRPRFEFTLSQRLDEYPVLEDVEKLWICYQILYQMVEFQNQGFVHGDLHPDNIFLSWSLRVYIADPAPFKPAQVSPDKPHTFIHFFGSSSSTHCYLSPQRIDMKGNSGKTFADLSPADDLFSIGCITYFLYSGKHLFTLYSLVDYINGEGIDIRKAVEIIPESIREMVFGLLSIDPQTRMNTFQGFRGYFSRIFHQLLYQTEEYFLAGSTLSDICNMTPTFTLMMEDEPPDILLIFSDIFSQFLLESDEFQSQITFAYFLVEFLARLSDELLLTRVLPTFVGLLKSEVAVLKSVALDCIKILLKNIEKTPDHLRRIFQSYLLVQIVSCQSDHNYKMMLCSLLPGIIHELCRLSFESVPLFLNIFSFLGKSRGKPFVKVFVKGFNRAFESCDHRMHERVSRFVCQILSSSDIISSARMLKLLKLLYLKVPESERKRCSRSMCDRIEGFLSICGQDFPYKVLKILLWYIQEGFVTRDYLYLVINGVCLQSKSTSPRVRFVIQQITRILPQELREVMLPGFVMERLNRLATTFTDMTYQSSTIGRTPSMKMMKEFSVVPKPRFLSSSRHKNSRILAGVEMNPSSLFLSNSDGEILSTSFDENDFLVVATLTKPARNILKITQNTCALGSPHSLALLDLETGKEMASKFIEDELKSILCLDRDVIVGLQGQCDLVFRDSRTLEVVSKCKFDSVTGSCLSAWEDSRTVALGCTEGMVFLYDTRVSIPLLQLQTISASSVVPIAGKMETILVSNSKEFAIYEVPARKKYVSCSTAVDGILSKSGHGVVVSPDSVFLVNLMDDVCYRFYSDGPMEVHEIQTESFTFDAPQYPPLHKHAAKISFVMETFDGMISGDVIGNVNRWCI